MSKGWNDSRPMSPHLSVWKWHPTMLSSILHRASGIVLYFGLLKICIVLAFLAAGPRAFAAVEPLVFSALGAVSFFVFTGVLSYHLLNGLRHLVWDAGHGFDPKLSNTLSIVIIALSAILAAGLTWMLIGGLS